MLTLPSLAVMATMVIGQIVDFERRAITDLGTPFWLSPHFLRCQASREY